MDLAHIVEGKYHVEVIAYFANSLGGQVYLEQASPAFFFEIEEEINEDNFFWFSYQM